MCSILCMQQKALPTSVYTAVRSVITSQEHKALADVDLMLRVLWTLAGIIREIPEAVDELIQLAHQVLACVRACMQCQLAGRHLC
jgi:hypothetical protein